MYTIEPTDHWRAGDRAYCVRGLKMGQRYVVESGRLYTVESARQINGMMNDALTLVGVDHRPSKGFWSSRFVCLRGKHGLLAEISQRTRHGSYEAYRSCRDARHAAMLSALEDQ